MKNFLTASIEALQLENLFSESENKINPRMWDKKIISFNIKYMLKEFIFISVLIGGLLSLLNIFPFINMGMGFIWIGIIVGAIRLAQQLNIFFSFTVVPLGFIGIATIIDEIQGEFVEGKMYYFIPGKYRNIVNVIGYGEIFKIYTPPIRYDNFDYEFEGVLTKDGIPVHGKHTGRSKLVNPYAWLNLLLSTKDEKIHYKKVEDVSLEAMNDAADDLTAAKMLKATASGMGDATDLFKKHYGIELGNIPALEPPKTPFIETDKYIDDGLTFYYPETGLNISFNIKSRMADKKTMEAIAAEYQSEEEAKAIKIKAEAEKIRLTLEGEGKAAAQKKLDLAVQEVFTTSLDENIENFTAHGKLPLTDKVMEKAIHHASLTANQYETEILTSIGNSDGSPIDGSLEKIIALARGMIKNK